jgi:hypothetical protein
MRKRFLGGGGGGGGRSCGAVGMGSHVSFGPRLTWKMGHQVATALDTGNTDCGGFDKAIRKVVCIIKCSFIDHAVVQSSITITIIYGHAANPLGTHRYNKFM